ncbi:DUF4013 domain-containing protein [Halorubrum sp. AD140]|uniref:DUF4013 domain-containing protein n=1 Tax=Halorubrum sp. AD140 TaxID=3050073 RepID=UPI002ACD1F54|nr:DUF4013 domain-containing protein [Halorubrum sp. AD140]MDZ5810795.1 DUF4013 domain-containing protein [Halorubrum sp. AD140]
MTDRGDAANSPESWHPVTWREAFRFPIANASRRRDILVGGTVLLIPPVGWILNLGHRLDVVYRLAEDSPPYFRGFKPWTRTFQRGLRAFLAIVVYLSPSGIVGIAALSRWYVAGGDTVAWGFAGVSALLFALAIFTLPGGMTINAARRDMSYLYRPDKAFRRAMEGGRRYLKSWAIALSAIALSFVGLAGLGVGYLYASVWAWSVVGYTFSRALVLPTPPADEYRCS